MESLSGTLSAAGRRHRPRLPNCAPPAAAASPVRPVFALRRSPLAILHFRVQVLCRRTTGRALLIERLFALLCVGLAVGMFLLIVLAVLLSVSLCVGMLLLVIFLFLLRLLLCLLRVYVLPGIRAVVVFLPARPVVLINVTVMSGIHISAGVLAGISLPGGCESRGALPALGALNRAYRSVGG